MVHAAGRNEAAAQAVSSFASASAPSFELAEATIADLQASMQSGARTAVSIAQGYLARMDAIDREGPRSMRSSSCNPDALAIAEALDRERRDKGPRGPLHGIPVLLRTTSTPPTGCAPARDRSRSASRRAARDAFVVERLRAAGCVIPRQDQPLRMGEFPELALDVAAGAAAAGRRATRMRSIAIRAARARDRGRRSRRTCARSPSAPKPTARS